MTQIRIKGHVSARFDAVRDAFAENFFRRHELGGACCVYYRGEKVVDLWGGVRNKQTGEPWQEDTMVLIWLATKGLAAMTLAVAHSRGWLDYEERVCTFWPEFAQNGKEGRFLFQGCALSICAASWSSKCSSLKRPTNWALTQFW